MTLRVFYDGGLTYGPVREVQVDPGKAVILGSPTKYPPCGCPRCTGRSSLSARSLRPVAVEPKAT
ncbi:hypothetical protein D9753_05630 [Streptomyces dangxiongensis]|uniref:Uncharacterized protein n=1 Tax=Streptomyces dangxiongensis TaxID=1442032 RepID=A0A3G2JMC7_9ACTN|nr:hypothetical protein D9753_05630 [Streptomyces dangxiongensis]